MSLYSLRSHGFFSFSNIRWSFCSFAPPQYSMSCCSIWILLPSRFGRSFDDFLKIQFKWIRLLQHCMTTVFPTLYPQIVDCQVVSQTLYCSCLFFPSFPELGDLGGSPALMALRSPWTFPLLPPAQSSPWSMHPHLLAV